jgi:hypothetical protein
MAVNMKGQVRDLLAGGYSQEQVLRYFESSYGEFVLLAPPKEGIALVVWVLPALFLVVGAGVVWRVMARAPLATNEPPAAMARGVAPRRMRVATMIGGVVGAGVIGALIVLANATATPRPAPAAPTSDAFAIVPDPDGRISGVIELDRSAARGVVYPAIVFVYARPEAVSTGPPVAAVRLAVSSFPATFSLGPEDAMMGDALPAKVRIDARIDPDGNASTREPDASKGFVDRVALGARDLRIRLK